MPQMSGTDLARSIWQARPETPIVLSTGYSATLDAEKAVQMGFRDLLLKPYNVQALGECVQCALAGSREK
jgi:DNA-binding NarL/FixJ family response regulator